MVMLSLILSIEFEKYLCGYVRNGIWCCCVMSVCDMDGMGMICSVLSGM